MSGGVVERHGRALEDAFFARQDELLLRRLREADSGAARRQAMAAASGITDAALLEQWDALGLDAATVASLSLVPLVLVAWADGALDAGEKAAVLRAAEEAGLAARPEAAALLASWLSHPPGAQLAKAWHDYAAALSASLAPGARDALREETIGRARRVAAATGGFLGLGQRVSAAEERVLADLARAFGG